MSPQDRIPGEVQVKKSADIEPTDTSTDGMIRMAAIVDMSDQLCGTGKFCTPSSSLQLLTTIVMTAKPHSKSAVHHHGEEDTIIYVAKGHGAIVSGPNGEKRHDIAPGDFALIPAYAEHQEVNDSDEEVVWIITRGGRKPIVENLEGWSKSHEILPEQGAF